MALGEVVQRPHPAGGQLLKARASARNRFDQRRIASRRMIGRPRCGRADTRNGSGPSLVHDTCKAALHRAAQGPRHLGTDLFFIRILRVVIAQIFVYPDELAPLYHGFKYDRGKVVVAAAFGGVRTPAFHPEVHAAAKHQSRALRPVAQNRSKALASARLTRSLFEIALLKRGKPQL